MKPLPRTYDALFERYLSVPVEFARALVWMESGFNPRNKTGDHWGLFQVGPENLRDFNAAHKTTWSMDDMLDPEHNVQVWGWESERIRDALVGAGAVENWQDPTWVRLFVAGWNSGYSRAAGVAHVLAWLKANGKALTHDNVFMFGKAAGGAWTLQSGNSKAAAKYRWQRDVAATYAGDAAPGDPAIAGNLAAWKTPRIGVDKLTPPAQAIAPAQVASQAAPMPAPERARGEAGGGGGGGLFILALLVLLATRRR